VDLIIQAIIAGRTAAELGNLTDVDGMFTANPRIVKQAQ
jgi:aspartokinase